MSDDVGGSKSEEDSHIQYNFKLAQRFFNENQQGMKQ
jgi:hypothetical protein